MQHKEQARRHVAELAARQHGLITAGQLGRLGFSRERIARESAAGRLHRIHQGVYAVGHPGLSDHGRCLAAVLACGDGALLSHGSAAWLWGLVGELWIPYEVVAVSSRRSRSSIEVRSTTNLRPIDRGRIDGVPVCTLPLTLLQMAATRRAMDPGRLLARAERLGHLDLDGIDSLLGGRRGQRGVARLRAALDEFREPIFSRSRLERRFRRLVRESGLPLPSTNFFVAGCELDAYWPELRFGVEIDTYDYHGDRRSFEEDRKRDEELKLAGIEIIRVTGRRLTREPKVVAQRLQALLEARAGELRHRAAR